MATRLEKQWSVVCCQRQNRREAQISLRLCSKLFDRESYVVIGCCVFGFHRTEN